ncbi:MAG: 6-phosphofructokinase [Armatimonadetes bacterium]|nr:6-phosphofructokinase [Armatimonadota bacterium]
MMKGNLIVGQSGGPTAVVNVTLAGVVEAAMQSSSVGEILGMRHGVQGLLQEDLTDLRRQPAELWTRLKETPSAALGSSRMKVTDEDLGRIVEVLRAHDVRYFLYVGGEGSASVVHRLVRAARERRYELSAVAVPKTIDNDLAETDHCPGYPSVARWLAISVREAGLDSEAIGVVDTVKVIETMGRDAGWIAASTALARERAGEAPHLIYLPERAFDQERFLADVSRVHWERGHVVIAVSEGVKDARGQYLSASQRAVDRDPVGRPQLGGATQVLCDLAASQLGLKARFDKPGTIQRVSSAMASPVDRDEAYRVGTEAVRAAVDGRTDVMVSIVREPGPGYRSSTALVALTQVVGRTRTVPPEFIAGSGSDITEPFVQYLMPLLGGPLPSYARLASTPVPRKMS